MYQGARTAGAQRQTTNKDGSPKRRRRRPQKKKNPGAVTWILIAGGVAVATGVGIGVYAYRKKKKGALPPGPPAPGPGPGPGPSPGRPGRGKDNAPSFPYSTAEAKAVEVTWAIAFVAENCDPSTGTLARNVNAISDQVFNEMYKLGRKIPGKSTRGTGWQPYIDSWIRIRDAVEKHVAESGC